MFIAIEGPDGSGKSSQSKALAEWMGAEWRCFPDRRTPIGKLIDLHLKGRWAAKFDVDDGPPRDMTSEHLDALTFQALQLANRAEVSSDILATLRCGKSVVCDRYWGSGYAYGVADGLNPEYMISIHRYLPAPALNILLDVPIGVSSGRLASRGGALERYEGSVAFMETVANNYRALWASKKSDPCWVVVDGSGSREETFVKLKALIPPEVLKR